LLPGGVAVKNIKKGLESLLKELHLPTVRDSYEDLAHQAEQEGQSYEQFLFELVEMESQSRRARRLERMLRQSKLPPDKTLASFDLKRIPVKVRQQVKTLVDGAFLDRKENVLAFGQPGTGKTHVLCAIGQELIYRDRKVYFASTQLMVQELLIAKRDLALSKLLKKLSRFDALILDDLGYVQQSREEMEVLFTLLAERYERGSVMITSNLPFSKWEAIFKDPMTTAAAIDRLVHHSVILELNVSSFRVEQAKKSRN
jgi:DNA replication protein DnaC